MSTNPPPRSKPALVRDSAKATSKAALAAATAPIAPVESAPKVALPTAPAPAKPVPQLAAPAALPALLAPPKGYDEMLGVGKDNVEILTRVAGIYAKGFEELGRSLMALAEAQMRHAVAASKAALGVTTLRQMVDVQADYARASFDSLVSESTKISETGMKVANEAFQPIQARMTQAMGKFARPAA